MNEITKMVLTYFGIILSAILSLSISKRMFSANKEYAHETEQDKKINLMLPWAIYDEREKERKRDCEKQHANCIENFTLRIEKNTITNENLIEKLIEHENNIARKQIELDSLVKNLSITIQNIDKVPINISLLLAKIKSHEKKIESLEGES